MNTQLAQEIISAHTQHPISLVVQAVRALAVTWAIGL